MEIRGTYIYKNIRKMYYYIKSFNSNRKINKIKKVLRNFKNIHNAEICFIIGNGPSLKIEDLERIQKAGYKTFGCNRIYVAFDSTEWRPDYYFMADGKLLKEMENNFIDIPYENRFYPFSKKKNGLKGISYISEYHGDWDKIGRFSKNASECVYEAGSVTIEMIQFAYYMGFKAIYLIGIDFSYNTTKVSNDGTYEYQGENNYFVSNYMKKGEVADVPSIEPQLRGYEEARRVIESEGKIIKNATRGGKLEVFERVNLDDLINI